MEILIIGLIFNVAVNSIYYLLNTTGFILNSSVVFGSVLGKRFDRRNKVLIYVDYNHVSGWRSPTWSEPGSARLEPSDNCEL